MKLMVNCGNCDARSATEETLTAYEQITINCGTVFVTPESKNLLNRYAVNLNCGNVVEMGKDVYLSSVNGKARIKATDAVPGKTFLHVNGTLQIDAGTENILERYEGIAVNGEVQCPESMSVYLGKMKVNGAMTYYPDRAVVLKRNAVIDRTFVLRAKEKLYWSARRMVIVDPQLDGRVLADKGATFSSKEVILAEDKVESLLETIDEEAELIIVPQGTRVILDDVELSGSALKRYGNKLFIIGDLEVPKNGGKALESLEYLRVDGDVKVWEDWKDLLLEKAEISGDIKTMGGKTGAERCVEDKPLLKITKWMLEQGPLHVEDCMKVCLDEDIPREMILEKLTICDCSKVVCSSEQEGAVSMISEDVMKIGTDETDEAKGLPDTKTIYVGDYVL